MVFLSVFTSLARRYRMLPNGNNFISYSENTNTGLLRKDLLREKQAQL